jgi:hypothetical protein
LPVTAAEFVELGDPPLVSEVQPEDDEVKVHPKAKRRGVSVQTHFDG